MQTFVLKINEAFTMKKRPVTLISIGALLVLAVCLFVVAFNSGLPYHGEYAALTDDAAALSTVVRGAVERANLFAAMAAIVVVCSVYLVWWVVCAYVIIRRMRVAGISRGIERYCLSLLPFVACGWWAHMLLDSRPAEYLYAGYIQCLLAALGALCCGVLISIAVLYFCCHLPWRKRMATQENPASHYLSDTKRIH